MGIICGRLVGEGVNGGIVVAVASSVGSGVFEADFVGMDTNPAKKTEDSKKADKTKKFPIRVDLDREDAAKFKAVKDQYKLKNKAEVLRFCVNKVYHGTALEVEEDVHKEISNRDKSDQVRQVGPLKPADDAIVIDTTALTLEQVVEKLFGFVKEKCLKKD